VYGTFSDAQSFVDRVQAGEKRGAALGRGHAKKVEALITQLLRK
jgi:hypothetical protein